MKPTIPASTVASAMLDNSPVSDAKEAHLIAAVILDGINDDDWVTHHMWPYAQIIGIDPAVIRKIHNTFQVEQFSGSAIRVGAKDSMPEDWFEPIGDGNSRTPRRPMLFEIERLIR